MQYNSLCKCKFKSFVRRTVKEWPKVFVVSLHQFLNGGRQNLLRAGDRAIHDPVKAAEHKTHIRHCFTPQVNAEKQKSNVASTEPRHVVIMWTSIANNL